MPTFFSLFSISCFVFFSRFYFAFCLRVAQASFVASNQYCFEDPVLCNCVKSHCVGKCEQIGFEHKTVVFWRTFLKDFAANPFSNIVCEFIFQLIFQFIFQLLFDINSVYLKRFQFRANQSARKRVRLFIWLRNQKDDGKRFLRYCFKAFHVLFNSTSF